MTIWNPKTGKKAAKSRKSHRRAKPDRERTKRVYDTGGFKDKRSFYDVEGRLFLAGEDMSWQREVVLQRDGNICVRCGAWRASAEMQVHHKKHKGHPDFGSDDLENLETLCASCHEKEHNRSVQWSKKVGSQATPSI
jgi:HNH endonuclease